MEIFDKRVIPHIWDFVLHALLVYNDIAKALKILIKIKCFVVVSGCLETRACHSISGHDS